MAKTMLPFSFYRCAMARLNGQVPLIGQQKQQAMIQIMQEINALSLSIYSKLACEYLGAYEHSHVDVERLKVLALNSRAAAQAYFEGLGVIERQ